jgi:hypothetical protein
MWKTLKPNRARLRAIQEELVSTDWPNNKFGADGDYFSIHESHPSHVSKNRQNQPFKQ